LCGCTGNRGVGQYFVYHANNVFDANLRFYQVFIGAESLAAGALVFAGKRGHHNDFDVFGFGGGAQYI